MNLQDAIKIQETQTQLNAQIRKIRAFFLAIDSVNNDIDPFAIVAEFGFDAKKAKHAYLEDEIGPYFFEVSRKMSELQKTIQEKSNALPAIPIMLRIEMKKAN